MKKILISIFMALVVLNSVNAIDPLTIFSVGNIVGLKLPDSMKTYVDGLSQAQQKVLCVTDVYDCATNQIMQKLGDEAYKLLPENVKKIYNTYNQIKGYTEQGAQILKEVTLDKDGNVVSGSIHLKESSQIGNLVGKNIKQEDIRANGVVFTKDKGVSNLKFKDKGASLTMGKNTYANIDNTKDSSINLNENGGITSADLTTNEKSSTFVFNDKKVVVLPHTQVIYKDGKITMNAKGGKGLDFTLSQMQNGVETAPQKYTISGNGDVSWTGKGLEINNGATVKDTDLKFIVSNSGKEVLFLTNSESNIGIYKNNYIVANENLLKFNAKSTDIELLSGNKWVDMKESNELKFKMDGTIGAGQITKADGFTYINGNITEISCDASLKYTEEGANLYDSLTAKGKSSSCVKIQNNWKEQEYPFNGEEGILIASCSEVSENIEVIDAFTGMLTKPKPSSSKTASQPAATTKPKCIPKTVCTINMNGIEEIGITWPPNMQFCYNGGNTYFYDIYNEVVVYKDKIDPNNRDINPNCINKAQWQKIVDRCEYFKKSKPSTLWITQEQIDQGKNSCAKILKIVTTNDRKEIKYGRQYTEDGWTSIYPCEEVCLLTEFCNMEGRCVPNLKSGDTTGNERQPEVDKPKGPTFKGIKRMEEVKGKTAKGYICASYKDGYVCQYRRTDPMSDDFIPKVVSSLLPGRSPYIYPDEKGDLYMKICGFNIRAGVPILYEACSKDETSCGVKEGEDIPENSPCSIYLKR